MRAWCWIINCASVFVRLETLNGSGIQSVRLLSVFQSQNVGWHTQGITFDNLSVAVTALANQNNSTAPSANVFVTLFREDA